MVILPFLEGAHSRGQCNTDFLTLRSEIAMTSTYGPMTPARKSRIWELWREGMPMSFIAADIEKPPATVFSYLLYQGGMEPRTRARRPGGTWGGCENANGVSWTQQYGDYTTLY